MDIFIECLTSFLSKLKKNLLTEITKSNPQYISLKKENYERLVRLQNSVTSINQFDEYIDTLYEIADFEINYFYLCGMRDSNKNNGSSNRKIDEISKEIFHVKAFADLRLKKTKQLDELQAVMTPEIYPMLLEYEEKWDSISGLEKFYYYSGGKHDKQKIDNYFDMENKTEWESLLMYFCENL